MTFLPAYSVRRMVWVLPPSPVCWVCWPLLAWLIPWLRPQTRLFSFAYFFGNYFLTAVLRFFSPWYLPAVAVLGYLSIGLIFDEALGLAVRWAQLGWTPGWFGQLPKILRVSAIGLVAGQAAMMVCVARQLQVQQELIENGLRRPMGLWLRDHARTPQDTVMLESLGYIGFFSGLKMLDYPGLASKEMVETRKRLGPNQENRAYLDLRPDWLVLRPEERDNAAYIDWRGLRKYYELIQVFDASDKVSAIRWLPGRFYVQYDQTFFVYHRKPDATVNPRLPEPVSANPR